MLKKISTGSRNDALIPRVQSPANFGLVSQMSTSPRSVRINRDIVKAMSIVHALRLEGENEKRLLVGRLKIACKGSRNAFIARTVRRE